MKGEEQEEGRKKRNKESGKRKDGKKKGKKRRIWRYTTNLCANKTGENL
jgi:hypothetical protein